MKLKKTIAVAAVALSAAGLSACATDTDAKVGSDNLAIAAEQFELERRIVFVNAITDKYLLEITGFCSIEDQGVQLEVTCKDNAGGLKKHFLGKSDNVAYVIEQLDPANVSTDHYRVIFKPEAIVPDIDRP